MILLHIENLNLIYECRIRLDSRNLSCTICMLAWNVESCLCSLIQQTKAFRISINNNLGRVRGWDDEIQKACTVGLAEGRLEMEMEMDVWREDLGEIFKASAGAAGANVAQAITLTIGTVNPKELHLYATPKLDGQYSPLIQDKQMETLHFRVDSLYLATPESS